MDDGREYGLIQGYGSPELTKVSDSNANHTESQMVQMENKYVEEDGDEVEEEIDETNVGDNELNETPQQNRNDDDDDDDDDNDDDDGDGDDDDVRHPKKRKLKSLLSSYEFAPRVPPPTSTPKPSYGGRNTRNTLTDWSEHETFVLLDAWGERFIKCGRKSLRSEEWLEVADRVSQDSKIERTDSQCRNRLDTLKKKYKKEKANLTRSRITNPKWVYFKKLDVLLSPEGVKNTSVVLNLHNTKGVDETRGTLGNSYSHDKDDINNNDDDDDDDDDDDSDLLPPKKPKPGCSFKLLADSINKFSEIYEKIENNKIQQMIELEKMKMEFHKELELQKRQILDRAQAEAVKARQGDYEDNDVSAENVSG